VQLGGNMQKKKNKWHWSHDDVFGRWLPSYARGTGVEASEMSPTERCTLSNLFERIEFGGAYQKDQPGYSLFSDDGKWAHFQCEPSPGWIVRWKLRRHSRDIVVYLISRKENVCG
jgi:hypothetical protein